MSDRLVDSGILVVYDGGDQFFHHKSSALMFSGYMEIMGHMCEFYLATLEKGKVTRCKWISKDALRAERP